MGKTYKYSREYICPHTGYVFTVTIKEEICCGSEFSDSFSMLSVDKLELGEYDLTHYLDAGILNIPIDDLLGL